MPRCPFIPYDQAPTHGTINPVACILHRTIGHWSGDYYVLKSGGLVQFLIGEYEGQWVEFSDTTSLMYGAGGANSWADHIEFSGQNYSPLTDWQLRAGSQLIAWLAATHNIPLTYNNGSTGRDGEAHGFFAHNYVYEPTDQHTDQINMVDWDTMLTTMQGATDMPLTNADFQGIGNIVRDQMKAELPELLNNDQATRLSFIALFDAAMQHYEEEKAKRTP